MLGTGITQLGKGSLDAGAAEELSLPLLQIQLPLRVFFNALFSQHSTADCQEHLRLELDMKLGDMADCRTEHGVKTQAMPTTRGPSPGTVVFFPGCWIELLILCTGRCKRALETI